MSTRHPRPNIRKAMLQRHETPFDGMSDAEIAEFRASMVILGKFNLSELSRRIEIGCVLGNLFLDLALRGNKLPAAQAIRMTRVLANKWDEPRLVSCVVKNKKSDEIIEILEPIIEKYNTRTQTLYPPEWR